MITLEALASAAPVPMVIVAIGSDHETCAAEAPSGPAYGDTSMREPDAFPGSAHARRFSVNPAPLVYD